MYRPKGFSGIPGFHGSFGVIQKGLVGGMLKNKGFYSLLFGTTLKSSKKMDTRRIYKIKMSLCQRIVIAYSLLFVESAIRKAPFFFMWGEWGSYQISLEVQKKWVLFF